MALIKCPECNQDVSDKASKCVNCGYKLKKMNKGLKITIIAIIFLAFIALITVPRTINIINDAKKRADELSNESYKRKLGLVVYDILYSSIDAESCGNEIKSIWYNTIYEKDDEKTDKYTKVNGIFNDDFNDSLRVYFDSDTYNEYIDKIDDSKRKIRNSINELKNPPEEYEDAYDDLKDFYEGYLTLTGMCTDPKGNLQTYSSSFNDADTQVSNDYNKMLLYIEE